MSIHTQAGWVERYAAWGDMTNDFITHEGSVLIWHNKAEMEHALFPRRIIKVTSSDLKGRPWKWLCDHPQLEFLKDRPMQKDDFIR